MPFRGRVDKRRATHAQRVWALLDGSESRMVGVFGSLDGARDAWAALAAEVAQRCPRGERPEAWWAFTPGVPDDLRWMGSLGNVALMVRYGDRGCPDVPPCFLHVEEKASSWCARRWPARLRREWLAANALLTAEEETVHG